MKSKWIFTATILVMLAYQAWRVFDYMSTSMMGVDEDTAYWVSIAFLTFTEIGLLVWLHIAQPSATTERQEDVSTLMVWLDYGGSMVLGLADLAKHNTIYAIDLSRLDPILFIAPFVIVAANVAAWIVYETNDSQKMLEREERRLAHAEHRLEIQARKEAILALLADSKGISTQLTPYYYKDIHDRVTGRTAQRFGRQAAKLPDDFALPERTEPPKKSLKELINSAKHAIRIEKPAVPALLNKNGDKNEDQNPTTPRQS